MKETLNKKAQSSSNQRNMHGATVVPMPAYLRNQKILQGKKKWLVDLIKQTQ